VLVSESVFFPSLDRLPFSVARCGFMRTLWAERQTYPCVSVSFDVVNPPQSPCALSLPFYVFYLPKDSPFRRGGPHKNGSHLHRGMIDLSRFLSEARLALRASPFPRSLPFPPLVLITRRESQKMKGSPLPPSMSLLSEAGDSPTVQSSLSSPCERALPKKIFFFEF